MPSNSCTLQPCCEPLHSDAHAVLFLLSAIFRCPFVLPATTLPPRLRRHYRRITSPRKVQPEPSVCQCRKLFSHSRDWSSAAICSLVDAPHREHRSTPSWKVAAAVLYHAYSTAVDAVPTPDDTLLMTLSLSRAGDDLIVMMIFTLLLQLPRCRCDAAAGRTRLISDRTGHAATRHTPTPSHL